MPRGTSLLDEARLQRRLWTPADLNPTLWLDAANPLNYTLSSGGRSNPWGPLDNVGDVGRLLYEPTGWLGRMPCFRTEDNGKVISGAVAISTAELYVAVVHREDVRGPSNGMWWTGGSNQIRCHFPWGDDSAYYWDVHSSRAQIAANPVGTHNLTGLLCSATRSSHTVFLDGVAGTAGTASTQTATTFELAGTHQGAFAEIVWVQGAANVSRAMQDRIDGYLSHKWGLASRLPASHPYRNSPPMLGG